MNKCRVTEIITCGDWYCDGHGVGTVVFGVRKGRKWNILGKLYSNPEDIFSKSPRDMVKVEYFASAKKRLAK